jgi:hypothetical protein
MNPGIVVSRTSVWIISGELITEGGINVPGPVASVSVNSLFSISRRIKPKEGNHAGSRIRR